MIIHDGDDDYSYSNLYYSAINLDRFDIGNP